MVSTFITQKLSGICNTGSLHEIVLSDRLANTFLGFYFGFGSGSQITLSVFLTSMSFGYFMLFDSFDSFQIG